MSPKHQPRPKGKTSPQPRNQKDGGWAWWQPKARAIIEAGAVGIAADTVYLVYLGICDFADRQRSHTTAVANKEEIAQVSLRSASSVYRAAKELERLGLINICRRKVSANKNAKNAYEILACPGINNDSVGSIADMHMQVTSDTTPVMSIADALSMSDIDPLRTIHPSSGRASRPAGGLHPRKVETNANSDSSQDANPLDADAPANSFAGEEEHTSEPRSPERIAADNEAIALQTKRRTDLNRLRMGYPTLHYPESHYTAEIAEIAAQKERAAADEERECAAKEARLARALGAPITPLEHPAIETP